MFNKKVEYEQKVCPIEHNINMEVTKTETGDIITFDEVKTEFDKYNEEFKPLKKEVENKIKNIDFSIEEIYEKYKDNPKIRQEDKEKMKELKEDKLEKASNEKNKISLFDEYFWSYLDACILIRNDMISKKKVRLIYSYLFNLVHILELNIKLLKVSNVKGFEEIKSNHDLLELYLKNKVSIRALGLSERYYRRLEEELKEISKFVKRQDIAMCFKYPFDKDFETIIINKNIEDISFEEINCLIERHKVLLMIIGCIYMLRKINNYKELIKMSDKCLLDIKEARKNIEDEIGN